jgi:hypothetical protein
MTTNLPMLDWMTVTTFESKVAHSILYNWLADLGDYADNKIDISLMGYKGRTFDGMFWGQKDINHGKHEGRRHWLIKVSGPRSENLAILLRDNAYRLTDYKVTRLDVQVTILGNLSDARILTDRLRASPFQGRGRQPKITLIESDNHTIYVGSRQSERMVRIYEKRPDDGQTYVRFEVELKGAVANETWKGFISGATTTKMTLAGILARFPVNVFDYSVVFSDLRDCLGNNAWKPVIIPIEHDTVKWLKTQVDAAIEKLAGDHAIMAELQPLFERWATLSNSHLEDNISDT